MKIDCDRPMVKYLLRCWYSNRLRPQGVRLARDQPRLLAKQNGICPLCGATLTNDEATHIDHVVSVDAFADRIMSGELTFDDAYCQLWADENLRAVCRSCNMARNKRSKAARTPTREVSHDGAVQR